MKVKKRINKVLQALGYQRNEYQSAIKMYGSLFDTDKELLQHLEDRLALEQEQEKQLKSQIMFMQGADVLADVMSAQKEANAVAKTLKEND